MANTVIVLQTGKNFATLQELYANTMRVGEATIPLLTTRWNGQIYRAITGLVKQQGYRGRFCVSEVSQEAAELLVNPTHNLMNLIRTGVKYKPVAVIRNIDIMQVIDGAVAHAIQRDQERGRLVRQGKTKSKVEWICPEHIRQAHTHYREWFQHFRPILKQWQQENTDMVEQHMQQQIQAQIEYL